MGQPNSIIMHRCKQHFCESKVNNNYITCQFKLFKVTLSQLLIGYDNTYTMILSMTFFDPDAKTIYHSAFWTRPSGRFVISWKKTTNNHTILIVLANGFCFVSVKKWFIIKTLVVDSWYVNPICQMTRSAKHNYVPCGFKQNHCRNDRSYFIVF